MEAVLICLTTSKLQEPVTSDDIEGHIHEEIPNSSLADGEMIGNLDLDEEYEDVDDERDLERFLANRNCPPPRRCGAVFGPTGQLFTFFPMDPLHHHAATVEKRQRSRSSSRDRKQRNQRRRLFESFGVIPSLQARKAPESGYEEAIEDDQEEDSDEVLNMPSLLMAQRVSLAGKALYSNTANCASSAATLTWSYRLCGDIATPQTGRHRSSLQLSYIWTRL